MRPLLKLKLKLSFFSLGDRVHVVCDWIYERVDWKWIRKLICKCDWKLVHDCSDKFCSQHIEVEMEFVFDLSGRSTMHSMTVKTIEETRFCDGANTQLKSARLPI